MKNTHFKWLALAALTLGGAITAYLSRQAEPLTKTTDSAADSPSNHRSDLAIAHLSLATAHSDNAATALQSIPPVPSPDAIHEVLPSVLHQVANWREYRPDSFTVKPTPESSAITFLLDTVRDEGRFTTWIGRSVIAGESFVAVATAEGLDAIVTVAGEAPVEIHIRQDRVSVSRTSDEIEASGCGALPNQSPNTSGQSAMETKLATDQTVTSALVQDTGGNYRSGVVVLYDNLALAQANTSAPDGNGASLIDSSMKAKIEAANLVLTNSSINVRWAYLGSFQCPDHGDTPMETLWGTVRDSTTEVGSFAVQKATLTGATHVLVYTKPTDPQWGGYANIYGHFAVIRYGMSYLVVAHELGHNFGLNHDRYTKSAISATYDSNYSYGMVFAVHNTTTTDPAANPNEQMGDVMSYSNRLVPYFTSPDLTINQYLAATKYVPLPAGNIYIGALATYADPASIVSLATALNTQPLGIPSGHLYACDGSRVFRENAAAIVGSSWGVQPYITSQPTNITATTGQSFSLNVNATGTGATFTYQWYKDSTAINGATSPNYVIASAATVDAGSYYVVVTANLNALGGATVLTSNTARVTVISGGAGSSGESGSGGGAINPVFTAALLVLLSSLARKQSLRQLG